MSERRSFFQDAKETLLHARPYRLWQSVITYFRHFRMISFLLRLVGWIVTFLQTGALVLLTTAILFVILPLIVAFAAGIVLTALLDTRNSLRRLRKQLSGRRVYVFFGIPGDFGVKSIREFAAGENTAVLVISPFWLSAKGLNKRYYYVNIRRESKHLFLVRRYFFFPIRKKLLDPQNTVYVY